MTNPFKPISRVNLHSEVMQQITAAIQSGQWKPGSKLPGEIALAEICLLYTSPSPRDRG